MRALALATSFAAAGALCACDGSSIGIDDPFAPITDVTVACAEADLLPLDDTFSDDNYTLGASQALTGSCTGAASERIYRFEPTAAGTLHFEWDSDVSTAVYAREVCASSNELLCEAASAQGAVDVDVLSGVTLFIVVEPTTSADYTFMATFMPLP